MLAGPISDAQIFYRPSKELEKFIESITNEDVLDDIPAGIGKFSNQKTTNNVDKVENIAIRDYPCFIQTSDIEYINSLELDNDVDVVAKCIDSKQDITGKLLKFDDLIWLHQYIEKKNKGVNEEDCIYFHKLFQGTEIILPKNEEIPRNQELEARCVKLRSQQENRRYKQMTKNVDSTRQYHPEDTISYQLKLMNSQLIAVVQFVFSVLAGFMFGFLGIELMIGTLDFGFRLLLGVICALTIALADLYFLAKKLNEDLEDTFKPTPITSLHENSKMKKE